ncbi:MAG TPA: hypothetical protein VD995_06095 [Azospirillum sp.]|nr:hypothetical protein [Azospirillum sp.]
MKLVYVYATELGEAVQAEILGLLRARFGTAEPLEAEERDAERGGSSDTIVTVRVDHDHPDAVVGVVRNHAAVIDAAAESFGERV